MRPTKLRTGASTRSRGSSTTSIQGVPPIIAARAREVPRPGLAYSMRPCRPRTSTGGPSTRTERSVHTSPLTLPTSNDASAPISAVNRCVASGDAWTRRQLTTYAVGVPPTVTAVMTGKTSESPILRSGPSAAPVSVTAAVRACVAGEPNGGIGRPTASRRSPAAFQSSTAALSESLAVRLSRVTRAASRAASPGRVKYARTAGWVASWRTSAARCGPPAFRLPTSWVVTRSRC